MKRRQIPMELGVSRDGLTEGFVHNEMFTFRHKHTNMNIKATNITTEILPLFKNHSVALSANPSATR